jgi:hypothetical protein
MLRMANTRTAQTVKTTQARAALMVADQKKNSLAQGLPWFLRERTITIDWTSARGIETEGRGITSTILNSYCEKD